jgi:hypothetical protein
MGSQDGLTNPNNLVDSRERIVYAASNTTPSEMGNFLAYNAEYLLLNLYRIGINVCNEA